MRKLNKWQTVAYLTGGVLMAVGAGCCAFLFQTKVFCWIYLIGAILFVAMQVAQRYDGDNPVVIRLRRIWLISGVFFVVAGLLMVDTSHLFLLRYMPRITYITYVYNKWVMLLLAGAILQIYATHRISNELEKDIKKGKSE